MEMNRQTLGQRISATIWAKQHLVFFAIVLAVLDFSVPLLGAWLHHRQALSDLIANGRSPFYLLGSLNIGVVALLIGYIALSSWLRAGYIRSIVGSLHLAPQNGLQWASMAGLLAVTFGLEAAIDVAATATSPALLLTLLQLVQLFAMLVLLYADYAIVISGLDPLTAIRRSWTTVRTRLAASVAVTMSFILVQLMLQWLIDPRLTGSFADMVLLLVVRLLAFGSVAYVTDVILIVVYIDAIERRVVPYHR
jgi:hypothetical protein